MDTEECFKWGEIFSANWTDLVKKMAARAEAMGQTQAEENQALIWSKDQKENCRWVFVNDPSNVESVRAVYASDENIGSPCCFVVVKQPDPSDTRGDVIFDIFRLSPQSYLWHFNRVFTRPAPGD
jgi:hypothetical protein